jgi:DNA polymerase-4
MRKIIHIDMDCFFAAIECRDDPSVADQPVGVGGGGGRGVLTTCNYIARQFGCRSAMPVFKALELCPQLVLKPVRFDVYRAESRRIRGIFADYTELIEPLSLDEAYLDVSHQRRYAVDIAREIRRRIRQLTGLTASAGIGPNKMLAKIASDWNKPDGQYVVLPEAVDGFMRELPVRRIPGVGPRAEEVLEQHGVRNCGELQAIGLGQLSAWFGSARASELYARCRGQDDRPVEVERPSRSMSVERTLAHDLSDSDRIRDALQDVLTELKADLAKADRPFTKVFVKLKFSNFQTTTRECVSDRLDMEVVERLFKVAFERSPHGVRLIGVGVRFAGECAAAQLELPLQ